MLGVAAAWLVQVGIEIYQFFTSIFRPEEGDNNGDRARQVGLLGQKVFKATVRCSSSLIFASLGAGIGATLYRPSVGQWIGKTSVKNYNKAIHELSLNNFSFELNCFLTWCQNLYDQMV